jgi:hypothetical protein
MTDHLIHSASRDLTKSKSLFDSPVFLMSGQYGLKRDGLGPVVWVRL